MKSILKLITWYRDTRKIDQIQNALKLQLYPWQISYVLEKSDEVPYYGRSGRTLAHQIRVCLSKGPKIDLTRDLKLVCDHPEFGVKYRGWYRRELRRIYNTLQSGSNLKLRDIKFK